MLAKIKRIYLKLQVSSSPQINLIWGFFLYVFIGFLLLNIPWFQTQDVSILDNLFIATSAVSTTGLVTISVADSYTFVGELIVMCLFQLGGIGYMTLTTYYLLFTSNRITRWHKKIMETEFTMPSSIKMRDFIKSVILFTLVMEVLGAIGFFIAFRMEGVAFSHALWSSVFHSVSAFCTAGFSLYNSSFMEYQDNILVSTIISILAIAGSVGFILITDVYYRMTGKSKHLNFTTKIVIWGFVILLSLGTIIIYFYEPSVRGGEGNQLLKSFFQSMTAMTTVGFNTIDTGLLKLPILLLVIFLMYVGASPSGTAGGLKITTLTAILSILKSRLAGDKVITFMGRKIPFERLYVATSTFILYTTLIFLGSFLLSFFESAKFDQILFEAASALGTVGLSTGITGSLSVAGKIFIIALMFIGRVGVLTFGFALFARGKDKLLKEVDQHEEGDLAV